jgi:hypothetical protein
VRQSAAAATAEAVSGAGLGELAPWLERLWTMAFRVADDVKETGARMAESCSLILMPLLCHCSSHVRHVTASNIDQPECAAVRPPPLVARGGGIGTAVAHSLPAQEGTRGRDQGGQSRHARYALWHNQ